MRRLALAALAAAGCLEVPSGPKQECAVDSDCNTGAGEVCGEGVCWGDPPAGQFAATISAPATRDDLISSELAVLPLTRDGWLGDLPLERPITISGRVEAYCATANQSCSTASIAAEIRFTKPSRFPGGPTVRFSTMSVGGLPRGSDSFTIRLPETQAGDEPYIVAIEPEGGGEKPPTDGATHPAELVPPKRLQLVVTPETGRQTFTLGSAYPVTISGNLKDALGTALVGYRVVAVGRFDLSSAQTEVSTVDFADGQYSITLGDGVVGQIEIVATPYGNNVVAPELHLMNMSPTAGARSLGQPAGIGSKVEVKIPVKGQAGDGMVKPVAGARVIVSGTVDGALTGAASAELTAEAITDDDGIATLSLLDGVALAPMYRLRIVPPASSNLGVVYDAPFLLDKASETIRLASRIALRGTVVDPAGNPLAGVSVTARRSLRFLWTLAIDDQAFLDEIPAATTITPASGDFVVWVDPALADAWGHYDLTFETPKGSTSPTWRLDDIEIPRIAGQPAIGLDNVTIPDAAFIHGRIVDPHGDPVEGSALRIFQIPPATTLCTELAHAPDDCELDAKVAGNGESDSQGIVRLDLARP